MGSSRIVLQVIKCPSGIANHHLPTHTVLTEQRSELQPGLTARESNTDAQAPFSICMRRNRLSNNFNVNPSVAKLDNRVSDVVLRFITCVMGGLGDESNKYKTFAKKNVSCVFSVKAKAGNVVMPSEPMSLSHMTLSLFSHKPNHVLLLSKPKMFYK